ncbi:hypothetical protein [Paraflavitalea pollutisoli]|uniref:hypothetical protein n=1 Tax=Paraflavitalea pollutisoli TaxID=3034143 RepID=UPI0023EB2849|nr:hypothetical protein [Paraflavitalea sp. H1-2-19X]
MRKELETIREIEEYLQGQLSPADKAAFEARLVADADLQEAVKVQQEIMQGVERAVLQQQIAKAAKQFARWQQIRRWGWGGAGVLVIAAITIAVLLKSGKPEQAYEGNNLPTYNEAGEQVWADADRQLAAQVFTIEAGRDTILTTEGGIVLAVPANGLLDEDGKQATGMVSLVVKEALDAASIMRAGLSTRSGSQLLETGGMFFLDARQGSKRLSINPADGIYLEVPTDSIKPGMQLYSGKRSPNGGIDWVNPKSLEHDLTTVDIHSLDFYPPHYLDSLRRWGYDHLNKKFTDSLYYSFAAYGDGYERSVTTISTLSEEGEWHNESDTQSSFRHPEFNCIINPATIQTIWSDAYQQTLLATREFEARLRVIHASGENQWLEAYLEGLDMPMWRIDSAVAANSTGNTKKRFEAFAARRDGKVRTSTALLQKLKAYYKTATGAYMLAARKTRDDYWRQQEQLDSIARRKAVNYSREEQRRINNNLQQELDINLKDAYRQLGYDTVPRPLPPAEVYRVQVVATGWYNVDRAVTEATIQRQSMRFTDSTTQKTATITYSPVQFTVLEKASYDRLYCYLLPDQLASFMRVNDSAGVFREELNALLNYRAILIGYRGEQAWAYTQTAVKPGQYGDIRLTRVNNLDSLIQQVSSLGQSADLRRELDYFHLHLKEEKRRKSVQEKAWLSYIVLQVLMANEKGCTISGK